MLSHRPARQSSSSTHTNQSRRANAGTTQVSKRYGGAQDQTGRPPWLAARSLDEVRVFGTSKHRSPEAEWVKYIVVYRGNEYPVFYWTKEPHWWRGGRELGVWAKVRPSQGIEFGQELASTVKLTECEYQRFKVILENTCDYCAEEIKELEHVAPGPCIP